MVTVPIAIAVTRPVELTVAMRSSADDQAGSLPEIALPFASLIVAVICNPVPGARVAVGGVT
jgi:hypothetical protein